MLDVTTLNRLIDERSQELFDLLSSLVRINSENFESYGNEKACAEYIAGLCREMGLETDIYSPMDIENYASHPDYLAGRGLEERRNVTARLRGQTDEDDVMIMGHSDTVVIGDLAYWTIDPLCGDQRDGKIWGRGACDDKYALATGLFLLRLLREQGFTPKKNLLFTAYCDEERGGSNGALSAVLRYPCKRIVNMDCKEFEIWHCASGGQEARYCYHTEHPVDSAALTAQAIPVIMEVIEQFGQRRRDELARNRFYKDTVIPSTALRYMGMRAGNRGADLGMGEVMFIIYTDKTRDEIYAEYRELEKILDEKLRPMGIIGDGIVPATRFFHYGFAEPDCESIRLMQEAAREAAGREVSVVGSCLSDLSVLLKYGSDQAFAFGIGRGFGDYGGAHQPDEYIECDKLVEFTKIIGAYLLKV